MPCEFLSIDVSSRTDSPKSYDPPLASACRHTFLHLGLLIRLLRLLACKLPELLCMPTVYILSCNDVNTFTYRALIT